jgi:urease accessory protein UreH
MNNTTIIYRSPSEIDSLIHAFQECSLPRSRWTHEAHLTVALWYLFDETEQAAINALRNGIKRYNSAQGIETTKDGGYHETLTLFWVGIIRRYLAQESRNRSMVSLANGLIAKYASCTLPFSYYTRDRLMSWEARINWVEPDLRAIDSETVRPD